MLDRLAVNNNVVVVVLAVADETTPAIPAWGDIAAALITGFGAAGCAAQSVVVQVLSSI